jgi:hypothetical protein
MPNSKQWVYHLKKTEDLVVNVHRWRPMKWYRDFGPFAIMIYSYLLGHGALQEKNAQVKLLSLSCE